MEKLNVETAEAVPRPAVMIESFRAIGYSLETAISDIIDNSISAGAKNIYIERLWNSGEPVVTIKDDGCGMTNGEIIEAMRPGSQNFMEKRSDSDLGRFGLGLKTASFSQCRVLTVISKKNGMVSYWTWDLDHVASTDKWELIKWAPAEYLSLLDDVQSGTLVIWSKLDRVLSSYSKRDEATKRKFSEAFDKVKRHLEMTFHRFIEDNDIKLFWCKHEIAAWNPFCPNEGKRQIMPDEFIGENIRVKGYILPHRNNFSSQSEYQKAEGPHGFSAHQGFYVYRGKRLLLAGDWLGLLRKEEGYKLVRIQVDLPNSLDSEWQIDIKKSRAYPPIGCRIQLESYAKNACIMGMEVYKHRGKILRRAGGVEFQPLWSEKRKDNKLYFVVNRDHSIIKNVKQMAKDDPDGAIDTLLKFIEESIPTKSIYAMEAKDEETLKEPNVGMEDSMIKNMAERIYGNLIANGLSSAEAKFTLKQTEPFNDYEYIIDEIEWKS